MIFEGTYTVTHMPTHLQMAEESFHIGPVGLDGLLVESRHLLYGQNIATSRSSRVWVDANWMPSQIEMEYGFTNLEATVGQDETTVCVSDGKERKTTNYAVSRADLFFVLPGTLHAPLFATRRFCLKGGELVLFRLCHKVNVTLNDAMQLVASSGCGQSCCWALTNTHWISL